MAISALKKITGLGERLRELREEINAREEALKKEIDPLKAERDAVQAELTEAMRKNDLTSIKVSSGDVFTRAIRKGIEITSEVMALRWAKENNCFSVNKLVAAQKLKDAPELPAGFERVETEYISVRKGKEKE